MNNFCGYCGHATGGHNDDCGRKAFYLGEQRGFNRGYISGLLAAANTVADDAFYTDESICQYFAEVLRDQANKLKTEAEGK